MSRGRTARPWHNRLGLVFAGSWLLAATGCASLPMAPRAAEPPPLPEDLVAYYRYPMLVQDTTVEFVRESATVRESLVRFPLAADDFEPTEPMVEFEWYELKAPGRHPAILFNPILGGDYPLERGLCRFLARHGFHVALVHRKTLKISPEHPIERIELLLRQGVLRMHQVVDWMARQETVDPERMASYGLSMGGIATIIAAATEPRLTAHVAVLAGGSIPDILITTSDSLLIKPRTRYLKANHLDLDTFERRLRDTIRTDPLLLAPYVNSQQVLMVIALADRTIGRANSLRLWRALGRPKVWFFPLGHYTSYLALPYIRFISLRFLRERLGLDAP